MVVIFGWGAGEAQDLGEVAPVECPNCRNHVFMHHIRSDKKISLYFVPLIPYGSDQYLSCPICRHGLPVRPDQLGALTSMQGFTHQYRLGQFAEELYQQRVERFWIGFGITPTRHVPPATAPAATPAKVAPSVAPAAPVPTPVPAAAEPSMTDRLLELVRLHESGILTDDEFAAAKRSILGI